MKVFIRSLLLACVSLCIPAATPAQTTYPGAVTIRVPAYFHDPRVMTATAQTSTAMTVGGAQMGVISAIATSLTTATFAVQGTVDGTNFFPVNVYPLNTPGSPALTTTVTASGLYGCTLTGLMQIRFVTSGTFTGTSLSLQLGAR